jgi:hypothetical protein
MTRKEADQSGSIEETVAEDVVPRHDAAAHPFLDWL